jgi:hypothetical protein
MLGDEQQADVDAFNGGVQQGWSPSLVDGL